MARGLLDAKTQPLTCAVGPARSPSAQDGLHWFGPLARTRLVVLARPSSQLRLSAPNDMSGKKLVVTRGSLPDEWVSTKNLPSTRVADNAASYRMLMRGHADLWVVNELLATRLVQTLGGEPLPIVLVAKTIDNYLACHQGLPSEMVTRLNRAVEALKAQGALRAFGIDD